MDIAEKMATDIALAIDGGDWQDAKWFSKFHREAWIKAVQPYADEIERLRGALKTFADNVRKTNSGIDENWAKTIYPLKAENQRLREALKLERQLKDDALRAFNESQAALKEGE